MLDLKRMLACKEKNTSPRAGVSLPSDPVEDYIEQALSWETSRIEMLEKSESKGRVCPCGVISGRDRGHAPSERNETVPCKGG
jgi:hypothetical protein